MEFRIFRNIVTAVLVVVAGWLAVQGAMILADGDQTVSALQPVAMLLAAVVLLGATWFALWSPSPVHRILENIFSIPELTKKLAFTVGLLCIYRIGFHVPLPGLDQVAMKQAMERLGEGAFGEALAYISMLSGGSLQRSTLFGLGIMPYITASIIFQLLTTVVPSLEKLAKEGQAGQKKIQEYTRYLTVLLCIIQGSVWMRYMFSADLLYPEVEVGSPILIFFVGVLGMTTGTVFLMWLGEQIDEYGIGNGISLLIMAGIVSRLPGAVLELSTMADFSLTGGASGSIGPLSIVFLIGAFVFVVAGAILITQGQRRIPIQQAKHTRGRRVYGGQRHYMPLRVNHGGVMPIIFASSLMIFPNALLSWLSQMTGSSTLGQVAAAFQNGSYLWSVCYIAMIFFFAYFWTTVQFRPKEMADQLRDYGHFIPGLRPGRRTAEYLERVMERITYCGAAFLATIAVLPTAINAALEIPFSVSAFLGGTGLLITVSVTLDLVQRIEAQLVMRNYGGFLGGSARIKGAYR
jgi:preprotein translocase subunit SecY